MKNIFFYDTDIGSIGIAEENGYITKVTFENISYKLEDYEVKESELIKKAYIQLEEFLGGERKEFKLPLKPLGTEFQNKVWEELCNIPYGETRSYKEIAINIGNEKASRAVGSANNKNPIPIFIPCHRVIGSKGKLVGYLGGVHIKEKLLELEKNFSTKIY